MGSCCSTKETKLPAQSTPPEVRVVHKPEPPIAGEDAAALPPPPAYDESYVLTPQAELSQDAAQNPLILFRQFALKFGVPDTFAALLRSIGDCKVVIACDDSGSMNAAAYSGEYVKDPYGPIPSRFDELFKMVEIVMNLSGVLSKSPIDLYFMNRPPRLGVTRFDDVRSSFAVKPTQYNLTPTVPMLRAIVKENEAIMAEHNLLIYLATDGEPTDSEGKPDVEGLNAEIARLMQRYPRLFVTFMACVSDERLLGVMDALGAKYDRVGVVDQFPVEHKEMMEKHKDQPGFTFSMGDYVTKAMLVAFDPNIKALFKDTASDDEK